MPSYQDYLDIFSGNSPLVQPDQNQTVNPLDPAGVFANGVPGQSVPAPAAPAKTLPGGYPIPSFGPSKASQVMSAALQKQKELAVVIDPQAAYNTAAGSNNGGAGASSASQMELDARNLSAIQLEGKYGADVAQKMVDARVTGNLTYQNDAASRPGPASALLDAGLSAGAAAFSGLGGIAALGAGLVNADAGVTLNHGVKAISDFVRSGMSSESDAGARAHAAADAMSQRDNAVLHPDSWLAREGANFVSTIKNAVDNPTALEDLTAQAAGSIASAGVLGKGLKLIGAGILKAGNVSGIGVSIGAAGGAGAGELNVAGRLLETAQAGGSIAEQASMAASIGLQEGGGSYQQTVDDALASLAGRSDLTGEQKNAIANKAALMAAAIQAPIGAVTGLFVAKFEAHPLRFTTPEVALQNAFKETVEEGIQSATGQLAQNAAIQENVDPTRDLSQGVGEQVALGALGGFTSAAGLGAPSLAGGTAAYAAKGALGFAADGLDAASARVAAIKERAQAAIPSSVQELGATFDNLKGKMSGMVQSVTDVLPNISDAPKRQDVQDYAHKILTTVQNTSVSDIVDTAAQATRVAKDASTSAIEKLAALASTQNLVDAQDALINEGKRTLQGLKIPSLDDAKAAIESIRNNPDVGNALRQVKSLFKRAVSEMTVNNDYTVRESPDTQAAILVAQHSPGDSNPDINDTILKHSDEGAYELTPMERAALKLSSDLVRTQREHETIVQELQRVTPKAVSRDLLTESNTNFEKIVGAMRVGDTQTAKAHLEDFMMVAQLLQNKVDALNRHVQNPEAGPARYNNLVGDFGKRRFIPVASEKRLQLHPHSATSVAFGRAVENDAHSMTTLANNLATTFSELKIQPIAQTQLNLHRATANLNPEVVDLHNKRNRLVQKIATLDPNHPDQARFSDRVSQIDNRLAQLEQATPEAAPTAQPKGGDQVSAPALTAEVVSRITPEQAQRLTDSGLNDRLNLLMDKRANKQASPEDQATFKILDEEMNKREDAAAAQQAAEAIDNATPKTEAKPNEAPVSDGQHADERSVQPVVQKPTKASEEPQQEAQPSPDRPIDQPRPAEPRNNDKPPVEPSSSKEVAVVPPRVAERTTPKNVQDLFSKLLGSASAIAGAAGAKLVNWFHEAFKLPQTPTTRTIGTDSPLTSIREAFASPEAFVAFAGEIRGKIFTQEIADDYQNLFAYGDRLKDRMVTQLNEYLSKESYGGIGKALVDNIDLKSAAGNKVELNRTINGKALNIVEDDGEHIKYNQELLEGAVLAGLQWMLDADRHWGDITDEIMRDTFGVERGSPLYASLLKEMKSGFGVVEGKLSLAAQIQRYWGVTANTEADLAYVKGISEAVAAELMTALIKEKMLKQTRLVVRTENGLNIPGTDIVTIDRFTPIDAFADSGVALRAIPLAIEHAVMIDPVRTYVGEAPTKVSATQLNNETVRNTENQKAMIANENSTAYLPNMENIRFVTALSKGDVLSLFGEGEVDPKLLNMNHKDTLDGRNLTLSSAYDTLIQTMVEIENTAKATNIAVDRVPVYYDHNFSAIGRLQQLGRNTPQGSKLIREMLLPSHTTVDLTDPNSREYQLYYLSLAQALGIKVHTQDISQNVEQVQALLQTDDMVKAIKALQEHLKKPDTKITQDQLAAIKAGMQVSPKTGETNPLAETEVVSFHALMDYARFQNTSQEDRAAHKTSVYLEADGVTNGPINALVMMTPGHFSTQWLIAAAKGGLLIDQPTMTMNEHRQRDKVDLYQTMAQKLSHIISSDFAAFFKGGHEDLSHHLDTTLRLMQSMMPGDITQPQAGKWELSRAVAKNPLTITLYGSGPFGIAGNMLGDVMDIFYEKLSHATQAMKADSSISFAEAMFGDVATETHTAEMHLQDFENRLNQLVQYKAVDKRGKVSLVRTNHPRITIRASESTTFTLSKEATDIMQTNIQVMVVDGMVRAIRQTVGGNLIDAIDDLRSATQAQGIFYTYAFNKAVADKIAANNAANPENTSLNYLSNKELDQIRKDLSYLAPTPQTKDQTFDVASSQRSFSKTSEFGRGFKDQFETPAYFRGPANPRVRGIPMMNIGMGDGYMMQHMSTMANAVKNTLKVFDGVNLGINNIDEGSRQANESAFAAWNNNPLMAVYKSFETFMKDAPTDNMSKEQMQELGRALFDQDVAKQGVSKDMIIERLNELKDNLRLQALSVEARHAVLREVNLSVDQMASAGKSFQQTGKLDLSGLSSTQIATEMNKLYEKKFSELVQGSEVTEHVADALLDRIATVDEGSQAKVVSARDLKGLLQGLKIPADQKAILQDILRSGEADGYTIVYGASWKLADYAEQQGKQYPQNVSPKDYGFAVIGDKTIYLNNAEPSSETLVHELIHAATYAKVYAYYNGDRSGVHRVEHARAIKRLEGLMEQFMFMAPDLQNVSPETFKAYNDAYRAIQEWLTDTTKSEAARKAGALNEFMAWNLSNQGLVRLGQRTQVANPLVRLARFVAESIKQLIFGDKYAPKPKDDFFSNLRFNTAIVMNSGASTQQLMLDHTLYQSAGFDPSDDTKMRKAHKVLNDRIITHLDQSVETQTERNGKYIQAGRVGRNATVAFEAAGFAMSRQERKTFMMIVTTLATGAELDHNVLLEAQKLYNHVAKTLKPSDFMRDPLSTDPNELYIAQNKFNVVIGNYSNIADAQSRSTRLSAFVALAMTNESFRNVLRKIEVPSLKLKRWNTLDGVVENVGVTAMDFIGKKMAGADRKAVNVQQAIKALTDNMVDIAAEAENVEVDAQGRPTGSVIGNTINLLNDGVVSGMQYAAKKGEDIGVRARTSNSKYVRALGESTAFVTSFFGEEQSAARNNRVISLGNEWKIPHAISEVLNEFIGRTDENGAIYDMIKVVRSWVQRTRQQYREVLPKVIQNEFSRKIEEFEWQHLFVMGKADIAALVENGVTTSEQAVEYAKDPTKVTAEIARLEASIRLVEPVRWATIQTKAQELARYMNTGKPQSTNQLRNAFAVAHLLGERGENTAFNIDPDTVHMIDRLTSLYAMQGISPDVQATLQALATNEPKGMAFVIAHLNARRTNELAKSFSGQVSQINHYKGYLPSLANSAASLIVKPVSSQQELRLLGYKIVDRYVGSGADNISEPMAYYYSDIAARGSYDQGILQNVRPTYAGVDPMTGFSNDGLSAGIVTERGEVDAIHQNIGANTGRGEALVPVYGANGKIIAYERTIDPAQAVRLKRNTNLSEAIGQWNGRQIEEKASVGFNNQLVSNLYDMWLNKGNRGSEFINVLDPRELRKDPILADAVGLINFSTRKMITGKFGKDQFWIRRDMLNDALGYRAASIGDFFTGNTRWPEPVRVALRNAMVKVFGVDAYRILTNAEKTIQNFVSDARVSIVIKSIIVPYSNMISNVFQLMSRGVPVGSIIRGLPRKTAEIDEFVKGEQKRLELKAQLTAVENDPIKSEQLKAQIKTLLDANRRMSIWPLIEAGEFGSISDVGLSKDDIALTEGRLSAYIEQLADKLPAQVKGLAKYGIVSRDTAFFKGLQRATEYGDFLGKAILYDHLTKNKGNDKASALRDISEEFVNYDRLAGRSRSYLENIGALWFWNFKIRSTKIAMNMVRNNPVHAMFSLAGPMAGHVKSIGSPILDNAFSVLFTGRSSWSIGPRMAWHAQTLNPWYNLVT